MSAVHDRWELVEPLLFAHALRDPSAFHTGQTKCNRDADLEAIRREHRFEDAAIAQAFDLLHDPASPTFHRHEPGRSSEGEPLHVAIRETAARWLVAEGDHWALRMETRRPGHEIIRWRGVTMLVPPSIVIAGALSRTGRSHPSWVQALPDSIAPNQPVGHLHLHLGPMLPFEALWLQLWESFLHHGTLDARRGDGILAIKGESVPEIGRHANKRQPGIRWQWMLELAFAARVWLLLAGKPELPRVLRGFGRGKVDPGQRAAALLTLWSLGEWRRFAQREARLLSETRRREIRRTLRDRAFAQNVAASSTGVAADGPKDAPVEPDDAANEVAFLAEALRRSDDDDHARVLYQYLRVKVALYRCLVVDPWTSGLRHFLDVVPRDKPYATVIDEDSRLDDSRLRAARTEKPLRVDAVEIHVPPARWLKQPRRWPHRHRWVLSFVRAEDPKAGDPGGACGARHWRRAIAKAGATCRLVARCVATRPSLLHEIRGLSLMHWERNGPVWLFESSLRHLIDASVEVAAEHPRLHARPLQTALHLGEDFDHLLSGLRQIFEPFEWGLIRRGDRIGHALALGLSPPNWCERSPWVRMRPWDRILDIGFVYWAFERLALPLDARHVERMRLGAEEAIRHVFDDQGGDPLETARNIWLSLPRRSPDGSGRVKTRPDRLAKARSLKDLVLDNRTVGRKALSLSLTVETRLELPVLEAVHKAVHDRVAQWQVAIEVNPSSNLLIAGFRSIFEQPVFHADDLPITLNADDPLTFATTLADEYAYAWAGMVVGAGQSPDQATRRLEEAARCSMRYVFTVLAKRPAP